MPPRASRWSLMCASSLYAFGMFTLLSAIPIAVKWLLVGRWKEEAIPIWSLALFPLLAREDAHAERAGRVVRRQPDLQSLSAAAGRSHRRHAVLQSRLRARLHRSHLRSATRRSCAGTPSSLGYKAHGNYIYTGPDRHRRRRLRRRSAACSISIRAWGTAHSSATHPLCRSGQRVPDGQALSRLPGAGDDRRLPLRRGQELHNPAARRLHGRCR